MVDPGIAGLLDRLRSADAQGAWEEFLVKYSPLLYQAARAYTADPDGAADCYLNICENLARNGFHRLLKFKPDGSASFITWLRVVARNLCFDWHRRQTGRQRLFKSLQHLSPLDLEVYEYRFARRLTMNETLQRICPVSPGLSPEQLAEAERRIERCLNSRQRWILSMRQKPTASTQPGLLSGDGEESLALASDTAPDQERLMIDLQNSAQLKKCLAHLPAKERLLLQLRFDQELSFDEIARLTGLSGAQRAHRQIGAILRKLRAAMR